MNERIEIWPYGVHAIDARTNLPVLPEGMFWRIRKSGFEYAYIEIRERRRFGSRKISDCIIKQRELSERRDVLQTCALAIKRSRENMSLLARPMFTGYGDYPPKKYNEGDAR